MHQKSVYASVGLHLALVIAATVSLPWLKRDFVIPPPISIELVDVSKVTETDKVAPAPVPKQEEKKEEPPATPPAPSNTSTEPTPVPKEKVKEEEKPDEKKEKQEAEALPDKKKKEEKKKEEKKKEEVKEKPKDFASVLKNLAEPKPVAPPTDQPDLKADGKPEEGQKAPLGSKLTMSEEDALRRQLEGCWNVPFGAKDAGEIVVEIFMVINPDRTLREARIVDTARYNSDTFFRAMADSALRAVRNPLCSPFQLPADKYDLWKTTTVNFNPSQM